METALKILKTLGGELMKEEKDCPRRAIAGMVQETIQIITNSPEDRLERIEKSITTLERVVRTKPSKGPTQAAPRTYTDVARHLRNANLIHSGSYWKANPISTPRTKDAPRRF